MFSDKIKRNIRNIVKRGRAELPKRSPNLHCRITERGNARAVIDACTENGMMAIHRRGMDCDCSAYETVRIVPAPISVIAFLKDEDEHNNYLDGPESMWIERPSMHDNRNSHHSRDLAMEAYENGHPHYVTWSDD